MTDVRELLARLNPTTIRYDTGAGGGTPELANIDIAGALGFVPAGLGREVLEAIYWPDGARLRRRHFKAAMEALVLPEIDRQSKRLAEAHLDVQLADAAVAWCERSGLTPDQRRHLDIARARLASVRAMTWPKNTLEALPRIADAVVAELASCNRCGTCHGLRIVHSDQGSETCDACKGVGLEPLPDRRRALAIGCDPSDYPRRWKPVFEWILVRAKDASEAAAQALDRAIGRRAA